MAFDNRSAESQQMCELREKDVLEDSCFYEILQLKEEIKLLDLTIHKLEGNLFLAKEEIKDLNVNLEAANELLDEMHSPLSPKVRRFNAEPWAILLYGGEEK